MAQEFCTLEQAAQMLGISPQELNQMAQRREVRAFADRGTWRFRIGDVQELARKRGASSDPELPAAPAADAPLVLTPAQEEEAVEAEVLLTPAQEDKPIEAQLADDGGDIFAELPKKGSSRSGFGSSDSGIILVPKGSDVELLPTPDELGPASSSFVFPKSKLSGTGSNPPVAPKAQSQLPLDEDDDSVVPLGKDQPVGPGDSQVRLDGMSGRLPDSGVRLVDFDLPSQLSGILPPPSSRKMEKPGSTINLERPAPKSGRIPTPSEYEQTAQFDIEAQLADSAEIAPPPKKGPSSKKMPKPDSSEFDLSPTSNVPGDSVFELSNPSMPSLELELTSDLDATSSSADALDLEHELLRPEQGGTSRRKRPPISQEVLADESQGTFEIKMDSDEFEVAPAAKARPESSEFDLSLEGDTTSSSDFELSLEEDALAAPARDTGPKTAKVPRQQLAAEETSDFELALDEDSSSEIIDESDSEVVVIDDDATDAGFDDALGDEVVAEEQVEEEEETEVVPKGAAAAAAAQAEWGWWSMALLPTVLIMPFVGLLLFEMMRSIWSYQEPYTVTGPIYELIKSVTK